MRNTLRERLEFEGFATAVAERGDVSESVVARRGYDAILAGSQAEDLASLGVPFIIVTSDGSIEEAVSAVKCGADGVHVGQSDMACVEARRALGSAKVVGVSAQTVDQALQAEKDGADYLGVGAVFPTGSKDDADDVSHDTVKAICEAVNIPVIAIGGISKNNVGQLAGLGLDGVAVISAIYASDDLKAATEDLKAKTVKALNL